MYTREITPEIDALPFELDPVHPGSILKEEFMEPYSLSARKLAEALHVPVTRISELVRGRRGITADTAIRLSRFWGTSAEFWLNLQKRYELDMARKNGHFEKIEQFNQAA